MADASSAERGGALEPLGFRDIAIVGGGCYGSFYAGQLERALEHGKVRYRRLLVVDRDPGCRAALEPPRQRRVLVAQEWGAFFDAWLADGAAGGDAIVPSPLMPHLMFEWLLRRAALRWPGRPVSAAPVSAEARTPYDMLAPDGIRYVSYADWLCPTHCIEPALCPATRAPRTWEMAEALEDMTRRMAREERMAGPVVLRCRHRAFGVGMFDVDEVLAADRIVAEAGRTGDPVRLLVGTVSSCHGAVGLVALGAAEPVGPSIFHAFPAPGARTRRAPDAHWSERKRMTATREVDVVIIGAGPAGLAAALYTGRAMLETVVLERGIPGGELLNTEFLEDVPGFAKILGRDLARKYHEHAAEFGADFQLGTTVERVRRREDGMFETTTGSDTTYVSPAVIVTAGGTPLKLGIPGELEYAGKGVSYCAVCDGAFYRNHHVVVAGGGDAACEEADYLTRFASKVTIIHRRDEFRASRIIQERVFANPKIEVMWNTVAEEAVGDPVKGMTSLRVRNVVTGAESVIEATGLFVFIGFKPNTGIIDGHYVHDAGGYVITDLAMHSSIAGLFVAGDMRAQLTRQVTTAQGDATTAAIAADRYIKALRTGHPDPAAAVLGDIGVPRARAPEGAEARGGAEAYGAAAAPDEARATAR